MRLLRINTIHLYLLSSFIFATSIFLYGFFPISFSSTEKAVISELPKYIEDVRLDRSAYKPRFARTALMIIDALRTDFILENAHMSYMKNLLVNNEACILNLKVHPPTVTMPRIKALTSGTIPSFIDVVLNLGSSETKIDTFLHQINGIGGKIVFYGDNTWTKMFPNMFMRKGENVDSLFVNDFYEGDKNITEKLMKELKHPDWKLLVLHYLGLDHIGHVEGPFSLKVPKKLEEMDNVISQIVSAIAKWNTNSYLSSLFIITGDHGMRDTGGHGGSSHSETNVPLIIIGTNCSSTNSETYQQIDVAATLSVLLGNPIPASSIGSIIPELIDDFTHEEQLFALHYNGDRLLEKIKKSLNYDTTLLEDNEFYIQHREAILNHKLFIKSITTSASGNRALFKKSKLFYLSAAKEMTSFLTKNYVKYDIWSMGIGVFLSVITLFTFILTLLISPESQIILNLNYKNCLSSSIIGLSSKHIISKLFQIDSDSFQLNWITNVIYLFIILVIFIHIQICQSIWTMIKQQKTIFNDLQFDKLMTFAVLCTIFHSGSFQSTSFIEEEHQTWYYFGNTFFILLFLYEMKRLLWHNDQLILNYFKNRFFNNTINSSKKTDDLPVYDYNMAGKKHRTTGTIIQKKRNLYKFYEDIHNKMEQLQTSVIAFGFLFGAHLFLRRLNQTGDKWLTIPDYGDWLCEQHNKLFLSIFCCVGLFLIVYACIDYNGILTIILTFTASLLIYYYRAITESILLFSVNPSASKISLYIFWLNILEIVAINYIPILYKRFILKKYSTIDAKICLGTNITIFCLISCLLHKPHNIILNGVLILSCGLVNRIIEANSKGRSKIYLKIISHIWIGKMFFFYQGNSNSLASIDLNAGYIGLDSFNLFIVGTFLTMNTFCGPILSLLVLLYNLYDSHAEPTISPSPVNEYAQKSSLQKIPKIELVIQIFIITLILPITIYLLVVTSFRYHIFVWTVFSPKLFYEFYYMCMMYVFMCAIYSINKCVSN